MTSPTDQREVERRAREEAKRYVDSQLGDPRANGIEFRSGYLAAAAVEPKLAVIEELEKMTRAVCHHCERHSPVEKAGSHYEHFVSGSDVEWRTCFASPLHARIAALKGGAG